LHRLQVAPAGPQLLVTTINAVLQRVLSPFRVRENVRLLKPGMEIGRESLIALLQRQGYTRTDTVVDAGEFAVRGSIFDIYPSGLEAGLRLDFFGDELETLRLFDPNTQRSTGAIEEHLLLPASEALLDEASIKRFRGAYRELFGANATGDPLYQAVSDGRRLAGMDTWLPLFEERGYAVLVAEDGEHAVALAVSAAPDLLVSDLVMPGKVSGLTLALWVRRERPSLPVLLATGHSAELRGAREHGFSVLQKPVDPDTLIDAVRAALSARTAAS